MPAVSPTILAAVSGPQPQISSSEGASVSTSEAISHSSWLISTVRERQRLVSTGLLKRLGTRVNGWTGFRVRLKFVVDQSMVVSVKRTICPYSENNAIRVSS